jgi:hypothetical protein
MSQPLETSTVTIGGFSLKDSVPTKKYLFSFEAVSNFCTSCSQKVSSCFKAIFSAIACPFKSAYSAIKDLCGRVFVSKKKPLWNLAGKFDNLEQSVRETLKKQNKDGKGNVELAFNCLQRFCENVSRSNRIEPIDALIQTSDQDELLVWIDSALDIREGGRDQNHAFQGLKFGPSGFLLFEKRNPPKAPEANKTGKTYKAFKLIRSDKGRVA